MTAAPMSWSPRPTRTRAGSSTTSPASPATAPAPPSAPPRPSASPPGRWPTAAPPTSQSAAPRAGHTRPAGPRYCNLLSGAGDNQIITTWSKTFLAPESFDRLAVVLPELEGCEISPLDPAASAGARNFYREDATADPFDYDLLAANNGPASSDTQTAFFFGGSDDFSHVVYGHLFNQTPDSPTPENRRATKLYDWTEQGTDGCATAGGCLALASVKPDGTPFTGSAAVPGIRVLRRLHQPAERGLRRRASHLLPGCR